MQHSSSNEMMYCKWLLGLKPTITPEIGLWVWLLGFHDFAKSWNTDACTSGTNDNMAPSVNLNIPGYGYQSKSSSISLGCECLISLRCNLIWSWLGLFFFFFVKSSLMLLFYVLNYVLVRSKQWDLGQGCFFKLNYGPDFSFGSGYIKFILNQ